MAISVGVMICEDWVTANHIEALCSETYKDCRGCYE
jgi:hypothetical protein